MAEIVASFLGPAIELGKCIIAPINRQFNYLCCFNSNIQSLRDEAKKLDEAREGLQMQVDRAKNNAEVILPEVETWLRNANDMKDNMSRIEDEISNVQGGCLAIKARFSLSKRAKETNEDMRELREQCKFNSISQPAPPSAMDPVRFGATYEFESRKGIEEDIMTALRDNKINIIGICGMGGIGKTTMAKRIMERVREENLFEEVVMVVISQQVDKLRIQLEIAETLGLKFEEETLPARAHKLRARLIGTKRILIVLDDVWEDLTLENLGIPCESGLRGCTALLTSRNRDVLTAMNVQKVCGLQILTEKEAWFLFREKAGTCVDDSKLRSIAEQVIEECKGLPIALVIVAKALKDENSISIWKDALQQLKRSNPGDIPDVITLVYNPLKLSYDFLDNERAKTLLLLCCLFLEDRNIPLEHLTYFAMGLHMFEGIGDLEEARNRTYMLAKFLKNRFLLLDGPDEYHVRMHDVVRDVSIFIASKERRINCNDCTWISSFTDGRTKSPTELGFPNLRLLWIDNSADEEFEIDDSFIEETTELNVLNIEYGKLRSLPNATHFLENLRTLILYKCPNLETVEIVGELVNLEIFICHKCESLEELPSEIGRLHQLRLLQVSKCENLETVAPGVISSLVGLEELKMAKSFDKWEAKDKEKEGENACLSELESLSNLRRLEIEVEDYILAAEQIRLSPKIVKFDIRIGDRQKAGPSSKGFDKKMSLWLERDIPLGDWIRECVKSVELMCLSGDGSSNLDLARAQKMRSLTLKYCSTVEKLVSITTSYSIDDATVFPLLEYLQLTDLPNLEEIYHIDGPIPKAYSSNNSFKNLKELRLEELPALKHLWKSSGVFSLNYSKLSSIYIENCDSLRNLFSLSTAEDCLSQLQKLDISDCKMMEQIFSWNEEAEEVEGRHIVTVFPNLEMLRLCDLPNLKAFCKGIERIEFPLLSDMTIMRCQELKSVASSWEGISCVVRDDNDDHSLHLLCKSKVAFGSLEELNINGCNNTLRLWCHKIPNDSFTGIEMLRIDNCGKITSSFSSAIVQSLVNLKQLKIRNCGEMVKVIEDEEEKCSHVCGGKTKNCCLFPKLRYVELRNLFKLENFCEWRSCALIELPTLESVFIQACPRMKRFSLGSLTTPKLNTIKIDNVINSNDINGALQQH